MGKKKVLTLTWVVGSFKLILSYTQTQTHSANQGTTPAPPGCQGCSSTLQYHFNSVTTQVWETVVKTSKLSGSPNPTGLWRILLSGT